MSLNPALPTAGVGLYFSVSAQTILEKCPFKIVLPCAEWNETFMVNFQDENHKNL